MRKHILLYLSLFVLSVFSRVLEAKTIKEVSVLTINSAITPATHDYLKLQFSKIPQDALILIKLNTPGGLVTTTKEIITLIGQDPRPVAVWITPEGASASSAGSLIASAAHFIFMTPGTNMGAATPIELSGDIKESDARSKAVNDLAAMVRSLSLSRGRPAGPFEDMIRKAESYTHKEALDLKIIDGVFSRELDLIQFLNQRSITLLGEKQTLTLPENVPLKEYAPTLGQKLLEVIANPSTAYILFLVGVALIYFEFQAPGGYIAGAAGFCLVLLAAIAFQVLPLDWGSFGLVILGVIFLILEVFVTSYGILSVAGLAALTLGSLFLFHGDAGFISIEYHVVYSTIGAVVIALALILYFLYRTRLVKPEDFFSVKGQEGVVMKTLNNGLVQIKVKGQIWNAQGSEFFTPGDRVSVIAEEHLTLSIKKISSKEYP